MKRFIFAGCLACLFSARLFGAESEASNVKWLDIALDILAGLAIASGGMGISWLAKIIAGMKWAKKLKIEKFIQEQAEVIVRFVENWAKNRLFNSSEKLQKATTDLKAALEKDGVKITGEEATRYIENALNKLKANGEINEVKRSV